MKKIIWLAAALVLLAKVSFADGQTLSLFVKGNEAYKKQDYKEAIKDYEDILKKGKTSGAIYYNLANAYYKDGQLGKAVLNYKRAQRLLPRDSDIRFNARYAAGFVRQSVRMKRNFFQKLLARYTEFYTGDEMVLIITLSVFGLAVVFLLSRFWKWPRPWRYASRVFFIMGIIFFGTGYIFKSTSQNKEAVMIDKSAAYFEPLKDSTEHFQLYKGAVVKEIKEEGQWVKIRRGDGLLGWVPKAAVEKIYDGAALAHLFSFGGCFPGPCQRLTSGTRVSAGLSEFRPLSE